MGEYLFTPALGGTLHEGRRSWYNVLKDGLDLTWWTKNAIFKHNGLLISYYYGSQFQKWRKHFLVRNDVLVIADSGGFQMASLDVNIDPISVLKWQEENADIGIMLDRPIFSRRSTDVTVEDFQKALKISKRNAIIQSKEKKDGFSLYYVLHGMNERQLTIWWKEIPFYDLNFDGIAISLDFRNEVMALIKSVEFIYSKGYNGRIHVLLLTGQTTIPYVIWLQKYFEYVTQDSSSYILKGARFMEYSLFYPKLTIRLGYKGDNLNLTSLPCDCPVCKFIEENNLIDMLLRKKAYRLVALLISLHNLYQWLRIIKFWTSLINNREKYREAIKNNLGNQYVRYFDILNEVFESNEVKDNSLSRWF